MIDASGLQITPISEVEKPILDKYEAFLLAAWLRGKLAYDVESVSEIMRLLNFPLHPFHVLERPELHFHRRPSAMSQHCEHGIASAGFFRTTRLRKNRVPEDLRRFWIGHSDRTITDTYSKIQEDVSFRRECADKVGLGFEIKPSVVRIFRKTQSAVEAKKTESTLVAA
jgi:hypothetical protein